MHNEEQQHGEEVGSHSRTLRRFLCVISPYQNPAALFMGCLWEAFSRVSSYIQSFCGSSLGRRLDLQSGDFDMRFSGTYVLLQS